MVFCGQGSLHEEGGSLFTWRETAFFAAGLVFPGSKWKCGFFQYLGVKGVVNESGRKPKKSATIDGKRCDYEPLLSLSLDLLPGNGKYSVS